MNAKEKEEITQAVTKSISQVFSNMLAQREETEAVKKISEEVKTIADDLKDFLTKIFPKCQLKCNEKIGENRKEIDVLKARFKIYLTIGSFVSGIVAAALVKFLT